MSFIRGAVITLFGLVLVVCLVLMNLSFTLSSSLEYDSLQPALKSSASGLITGFLGGEEIFNEKYEQEYCLIDKEYVIDYGNQTFTIPCEVIEQGKDSIASYVADNFIEKIYYAEYDCEFWECVKTSQAPFVLISDKARIYWAGKAFLLAAMSLVLFILIFLVSEKRPTQFISVGVLVALCALPFKDLNWVLKLVPAQISPLISLLSEKAHLVFIIMLMISIALVLIGTVSMVLGWKMKFKEDTSENKKINGEKSLSKAEVREIVKEEISKKNITNQKTNKSKKKKKN